MKTTTTPAPLTLERMRADIAGMLGEAPAAVGDDDHLMDLGLDSMRVLGLVLAWSKTGIALEFGQLAEHTTLVGWWGLVRQLQARGTPTA